MDRCAVLVDAGYLLGAAATVVAGSADRTQLSVDYPALLAALIAEAQRQTGLPVLQLLWYDGAYESQLTPEHRAIRVLPDVKLCLGELVWREGRVQQKGVDSYLQRDLTMLARNHGVADVVLVGGDEDLRRALEKAQDYGLRVHLWGVEAAAPEYNQSQGLIAEADLWWILSADWLSRFIRQAAQTAGGPAEPVPAAGPVAPAVPPAAIQRAATAMRASPADAARLVQRRGSGERAVARDAEDIPRLKELTSPPQAWQDNEADATAGLGDPFDIGVTFGRRWASRATAAQRATVLALRPKILAVLDAELLGFANRLGVDTWEDETAKFAVRGAFWEGVGSGVAQDTSGP